MDKETLSNYGWIVIAILVLTIMIALATPFGTYISNAVKSTTEALFDVQQKAMSVAGLVVSDQSFEGDSIQIPTADKLSGTWTFNDKLIIGVDEWFEDDVNFTFTANYQGTEFVALCNNIKAREYDGRGYAIVHMYIYDTEPHTDETPINYTAYGAYSDSWTLAFGEGEKTITFTGEQEVSQEFYAWLIKNATYKVA